MLGGAGATCGVRRRRPTRHACTQPHVPDDHAVLVHVADASTATRAAPSIRRRAPAGRGCARARAWRQRGDFGDHGFGLKCFWAEPCAAWLSGLGFGAVEGAAAGGLMARTMLRRELLGR